MAINNGQPVDENTDNAAFVSRSQDSNTTGKIDLDNADAASGSSIANIQRELNGQDSFVSDTSTTNQAENRKPTWASDTIGTPNQAVKNRVDSVQSAVETNQTNISTNTANIATNTSDIATNAGNIATNAADILLREETANKNQPNGYAGLNGSGQLDPSLLPSNALIYLGSFDPTGPTPNLQNGTGTTGDFYRVSVAGSHDFGAGSVSFNVGDSVIYNGATWDKYDEQTLADTDALPEGSTNRYYSDTLVSANVDVVANTAKVSADGSIDTHSDVDTTTTPPTVDQALVWNGSQWVPADQSGGGAGAGRLNFVLNGTFDKNIDEIVGYNDAAADPVDGDGGSLSNLATSFETVGPVSKGGFLRIARSGNAQGEGVRINLDTFGDNVKNGYTEIEFDVRKDANVLAGDYGVWVYDVSNATMYKVINDDDGDIVSDGKFRGVFYTTTSGSYRLLIHAQTTTATAGNLDVDNVVFGPSVSVPRTIPRHTKSVAVTPTFTGAGSFTFNSDAQTAFWREGNKLVYSGAVFATGAGSGLGIVELDVPPEVTTEFGPLTFINDTQSGSVQWFNLNATGLFRDSTANFTPSTGWRFNFPESGGGVVQGGALTATTQLYFTVFVRVQEWEDQEDVLVSTTENTFRNGYVRGQSNAGQTLTANVTAIPFAEVEDRFNNWNGSQYTAHANERITVNGNMVVVASATYAINAYINGSFVQTIGVAESEQNKTFGGSFDLQRGDVFELRASAGLTLLVNTQHGITITSQGDVTVFGLAGESDIFTIRSSVITPGAGNIYYPSGVFLDLPPGRYELKGTGCFQSAPTTAQFSLFSVGWYAADGNNTTTTPSASWSNLTVDAGGGIIDFGSSTNQDSYTAALQINNVFLGTIEAPSLIVTVTQNESVYLVPRASMVTPANARIWINATARKIK